MCDRCGVDASGGTLIRMRSYEPSQVDGRVENRRTAYRRRSLAQRWDVRDARRRAGLNPDTSEGWAKPSRRAWCGHSRSGVPGSGSVNVKRITDEHGTRAHFSGAQHCGNVWACPTCAPIVRRFRADEIAEGARRVVAMGGGMAMATFTIRHDRPDTLRDSFDLLRDAYADMSRTRAFRDWKSRSGLVGYIVAQEVTYGRFGWHPHRHVLFVFNHAVSEAEAEVFEAELFGMWAHAVGRSGGRTVSREAFDVRAVTAGNEQVAAYVTKVEKGVEGIGRELSLSDVKSGRAVGSVAPFQLLDIATPEAEELWCEYADATRGRSAIRWSRGLRARLGMDVEKSDEQVVDEAEAVGQVSIMIASDLYEARVSRSRAAALSILEAVEAGDLGAVGEILGGVAVPVELPGGTRAIAFYARLPEAA